MRYFTNIHTKTQVSQKPCWSTFACWQRVITNPLTVLPSVVSPSQAAHILLLSAEIHLFVNSTGARR